MGTHFNTIYRLSVNDTGVFNIHGDRFEPSDFCKLTQDEIKELNDKLKEVLGWIKKCKEKIRRGVKQELKEEKDQEQEGLIDETTGSKKRRKRRTKAEMELAKQKEAKLEKLGVKRRKRGKR